MWPLNNFPQYGNQFTAPKPNASFDNAFAQAQPNAWPNAWPNAGWSPNQGFNPGPNMPKPNQPFLPGPNMFNPNVPFMPMNWQPAKYDWNIGDDYFTGLTAKGDTKGDTKGGVDSKDSKDSKDGYKPLSGSGSINGATFKTGSGETWTPAVKAGQTYNLLSDGGVGLNGTFRKSEDGSETILGSIGLKVGDSNITFSSDGTLLVDGEKYSKSKNSLKGLVSEKDGTVTVKTNEGYTFTMKARGENGIKVDIKADNVGKDGIAPDGLWGALFDGEKQTESELKKVKPRDFEIKDDLTFDYEDNNALTNQKTLDDEDRGDQLFNGKNPEGRHLARINGTTFRAFEGANDSQGGASWQMNALKDNKVYNLFSDENFQINGKFQSNKLQTVGGMMGDQKVEITMSNNGANGSRPKLVVDGKEVTSAFNAEGFAFYNYPGMGDYLHKKFESDGETYYVQVFQKDGGLEMNIIADNQGTNKTRATGLLGDAMADGRVDNGNDANGAGYLRNADGLQSKAGERMSSALNEYMMDDLYDTSSGRSVYE